MDLNSTSLLWDLPQEVLDEIFAFAFPLQPGLKLITKSVWHYQERFEHAIDNVYAVRAFVPKVESFLVSKRFLLAAARAYSSNQDWHQEFLNSLRVINFPLLLCFARSIAVHRCGLGHLWHLAIRPNIKHLCLDLDETAFEQAHDASATDHSKYPWQHTFDSEELMKLPVIKMASALKYVQHFTFTARTYCRFAKTEVQKEIYASNMKYLKQAILTTIEAIEIVQAVDYSDAPSCSPLYEGSLVCCCCSRLPHRNERGELGKGWIKGYGTGRGNESWKPSGLRL